MSKSILQSRFACSLSSISDQVLNGVPSSTRVIAFALLIAAISGMRISARTPEPGSHLKLKHIATVPMLKAREVAFNGTTAWVGQNLLGMTAVDIHNPDRPAIARKFAPEEIQPLFLKQYKPDMLAIADRFRGLVIWNVADRDNPTSVGSLLLPGIATHLDVTTIEGRDIAVIACAGEGLSTVDITKPAAPQLLGRFTTRVDYSRRVAVSGKIAFLADHFDGGLKVLNLANPKDITPFYKVALRGFCESVILTDDILVVGYRNYGVRLFRTNAMSLSSETTPTCDLLCRLTRSGSQVRGMCLVTNALIIAQDQGGVEIYDMSNTALPWLSDEFRYENPQTSAQSCGYYKEILYIPSWDGGLLMFRISRSQGSGGQS